MRRSGYALILALLFATVVLMIGAGIASILANGTILNRHSRNTTEAYLMARSGMHDAINMLRVNTSEKVSLPFLIDPETENITSIETCDRTNGFYLFTEDGKKYSSVDHNNYVSKINEIPEGLGETFYAYQVCAKGETDPVPDYIRAVGFARGQKVVLEAEVHHDDIVMFTYTVELWTKTTDDLGNIIHEYSGTFISRQCLTEENTFGLDVCTVGKADILSFINPDETEYLAGGFFTYFHNNDYVQIYQVGP